MLCRNLKCAESVGLNNVYCSILYEQAPRDILIIEVHQK